MKCWKCSDVERGDGVFFFYLESWLKIACNTYLLIRVLTLYIEVLHCN